VSSTAQSAPPAECDIAVVGGGIVGLATARELAARHPDARIVLLEREPRLAGHQTTHSSGVIHAGIYYRPGSLKARLCVSGSRELYQYCAERNIPTRRSGKVIVATREAELTRLEELARRAAANGVEGAELLDAKGLAEIEPHVRGLAALHSPATGVVDFGQVAAALAEDARSRGATLHTGYQVMGSEPTARGLTLRHGGGTTLAGSAVFCAGAWADRLAVAAGAPAEPRIVPFRGAFYALAPQRAALVRGNVYPVPDPELPFLGVHLTRALDDTVHAGPSALMVGARDAYRLARVRPRDLREALGWPGTWRMIRQNLGATFAELRRAASRRALAAELRRFVPAVEARDLRFAFAGVRGQAIDRNGALVDDFVISRTERAVHVRNAPSPAATSCLPLARLIADELDAART
jgi:2-hydroxyglutarate dehydrogenase